MIPCVEEVTKPKEPEKDGCFYCGVAAGYFKPKNSDAEYCNHCHCDRNGITLEKRK